MQYYRLTHDLISYPQIKEFGGSILYAEPNHPFRFLQKYASISFSESAPEEEPNLDYLIINPRIKKQPADILSEYLGLRKGFIISKKFLEILNQFTLFQHKVYPCRVKLKDTFYDYHFLFFYGHLGNHIDFVNSPILVTNPIGDKILDTLTFKNFDSYKNYYKANSAQYRFRFKKIEIHSKEVFDMFGDFITPTKLIYISEGLKNAIFENKISNVRTEPLEKDYIVFKNN